MPWSTDRFLALAQSDTPSLDPGRSARPHRDRGSELSRTKIPLPVDDELETP